MAGWAFSPFLPYRPVPFFFPKGAESLFLFFIQTELRSSFHSKARETFFLASPPGRLSPADTPLFRSTIASFSFLATVKAGFLHEIFRVPLPRPIGFLPSRQVPSPHEKKPFSFSGRPTRLFAASGTEDLLVPSPYNHHQPEPLVFSNRSFFLNWPDGSASVSADPPQMPCSASLFSLSKNRSFFLLAASVF